MRQVKTKAEEKTTTTGLQAGKRLTRNRLQRLRAWDIRPTLNASIFSIFFIAGHADHRFFVAKFSILSVLFPVSQIFKLKIEAS
jgi:hypothetical protein